MAAAKAKKKKTKKLRHGTKASAKPINQVSTSRMPWDMGADGQANASRESEIVEGIDPDVDPETGEVKRRNPNGVKRRLFYDMLDVYRRREWITERGFKAGADLRAAWERTEKGMGGQLQEQVDSSPKADAAVAVQVDRMSALVRITKHIPAHDHRILMVVACEKRAISSVPEYRNSSRAHDRGKKHLREALDRLADRLGY